MRHRLDEDEPLHHRKIGMASEQGGREASGVGERGHLLRISIARKVR
jgi:hypothetical protein